MAKLCPSCRHDQKTHCALTDPERWHVQGGMFSVPGVATVTRCPRYAADRSDSGGVGPKKDLSSHAT